MVVPLRRSVPRASGLVKKGLLDELGVSRLRCEDRKLGSFLSEFQCLSTR